MPATPLVVTDLPGAGEVSLVLLHGLTQQRRFWAPVVRRLATDPRHPRVVAADLRGHGDTGDLGGGPYDVPTCAADVSALLDRLGLDRVVLVGHSWGGWVALEAAAAEPERVVGLALVDGGFVRLGDLGDREDVRRRLTPPALGIPLDDLLGSMERGPLGPWWTDETREALLPTFAVGDDGLARTRLGMERHMEVLDGALDYDPVPALRRVLCPTWLVRCEPLDAVADEALRRAAELLAQPRVLRWAGAVHDVPLQWPWLVAGLLRACLEEVAAPPLGGGEP